MIGKNKTDKTGREGGGAVIDELALVLQNKKSLWSFRLVLIIYTLNESSWDFSQVNFSARINYCESELMYAEQQKNNNVNNPNNGVMLAGR